MKYSYELLVVTKEYKFIAKVSTMFEPEPYEIRDIVEEYLEEQSIDTRDMVVWNTCDIDFDLTVMPHNTLYIYRCISKK